MIRATKIRIASAVVALISLGCLIKFSGYVGISVLSFFVCLVALNEYGRMILSGPRYYFALMPAASAGVLVTTLER